MKIEWIEALLLDNLLTRRVFAQCYKQWFYKPYFEQDFSFLGRFGHSVFCWAEISETTEILLKYATFWGVFFNFLWAKKMLQFF